jgi:hypothetical protein
MTDRDSPENAGIDEGAEDEWLDDVDPACGCIELCERLSQQRADE